MLRRLALALALVLSAGLGPSARFGPRPAAADSTAQGLPFSQAWSTPTLITTDDNWSGVAGIVGYRGDELTGSTGTNPQTILADGTSTPVDVFANQTNPVTQTAGGVAEFDTLADPVVALQGSNTADAPFLLITLDTTGQANIIVAYKLRDIDAAVDNAVQPVALHYRVGSSGSFTNVPAGYVADASTGPSLATLVTPVTATLPAAANDQALVQIRILTSNAALSDEWIGVDDLSVAGTPLSDLPDLAVDKAGPALAAAGELITYTLTLSNTGSAAATGALITDTLEGGAALVTYTTSLTHTFTPVGDTTWLWDLGDLLGLTAGALITVVASVPVTLTEGTVITNAVTASTTGSEVDLADNADLLSTTIDNAGPRMVITKAAPAQVTPGSLFTYTLTVTNLAGLTLTDLVLTDVVPLSTTLAYANDGGVLAGGTVSWTLASLDYLSAASVSFAVTATTELTTITNSQYGVLAGNYLTPALGSPYHTVVGEALRLHDLQGAGHVSPFAGQFVTGLVGVVTAVDGGGYYLQDPNPDGDNATSEAIFVDTVGASGRTVGELLVISGTASEFYPGGVGAGGLSVTQLDPPFTLVVSSTGNALPPPVVLGAGGRVPPTMVIDDDAAGSAETSGSFDADTDGLDFWESLEGMQVQVNDAVVVAGTRNVGEVTVVGDGGALAGVLSPRGTLVIRADDLNPERVILDDGLLPVPVVNAGAYFTAPIVGVMDYTFGNFKLQATTLPAPQAGALISETTMLTRTAAQLTIATFNVENLDPGDSPAKFAALADRIVNHLLAPDLIAVEEMQDNSGAANDGVVDASLTFSTLISAVVAAGGPEYDYRQIDPANNHDGGEPGGNIRVGFLFRTDRGLSFVDRPGATATTANSVGLGADGPQLAYSPGRVSPTSSAFTSSRKPLAGEFVFNGVTLFVIANHWVSKSGDDALMGRYQPPVLSSQAKREQQAQAVHDFVAAILALDANANIVVLGDLNDFAYSPPLATLTAGGGLTPLITTLPENERYSYVFDGNAQVLDHILVSPHLFESAFAGFDVVHVNAEFADVYRASDHDPSLVRLSLPYWLYVPLTAKP